MAHNDWSPINVDKSRIEAIDKFLESEEAKKLNVKRRAQLIRILLDDFFKEYFAKTGETLMVKEKEPSIDDILDMFEKKSIKNNEKIS